MLKGKLYKVVYGELQQREMEIYDYHILNIIDNCIDGNIDQSKTIFISVNGDDYNDIRERLRNIFKEAWEGSKTKARYEYDLNEDNSDTATVRRWNSESETFHPQAITLHFVIRNKFSTDSFTRSCTDGIIHLAFDKISDKEEECINEINERIIANKNNYSLPIDELIN